ncbi:MAG TPA: phage holin family protein [Firmicutes bacterium]|nr:phage holin family protein [Bacillota bacterium]HOQ23835.1 phage holin family protein [Bacillota bacterium]HPT66533.1 phage holin family protein [Bacillota bacterium]
MDWVRTIVRFVIAALVLMFIGYVVPGFSALSFSTALITALVIAGISYLIELFLGQNASPYAHGVVGFLVSALVIYITQFLVPGLSVSVIGALLASLVIGLIDLFIPTKVR